MERNIIPAVTKNGSAIEMAPSGPPSADPIIHPIPKAAPI